MFYSIEDFKRIIKETATEVAGKHQDVHAITSFDNKPYVSSYYG